MSNSQAERPLHRTISVAPIRICDTGGWTDTWFAGHGTIFNIGVSPCVEVQVDLYPLTAQRAPIVIHAENYGQRYAVAPAETERRLHPLLDAAIAELPPPSDRAIEITIYSEAPAGGSTGTSAAVCVALLGALDHLRRGGLTRHEIAYAAHRVEVERLGLQSGIQDQLCAAYGGVNFIEMPAYPRATVLPLDLPEPTWWELERRLLLIFMGQTHDSSAIHEQVIAGLEREGDASPRLAALRRCAVWSRDAVYAGDFAELGQAMIANTAAQRALHPALVSAGAAELIAVAQAQGALGWKINGAGGAGGSVTLLCDGAPGARRRLARAVMAALPQVRAIPTLIDRYGLRVWDAPAR